MPQQKGHCVAAPQKILRSLPAPLTPCPPCHLRFSRPIHKRSLPEEANRRPRLRTISEQGRCQRERQTPLMWGSQQSAGAIQEKQKVTSAGELSGDRGSGAPGGAGNLTRGHLFAPVGICPWNSHSRHLFCLETREIASLMGTEEPTHSIDTFTPRCTLMNEGGCHEHTTLPNPP